MKVIKLYQQGELIMHLTGLDDIKMHTETRSFYATSSEGKVEIHPSPDTTVIVSESNK